MSDLLSVEQAKKRLLPFFSPLGTETISLMAALGRVLASEVVAGLDLPLFTNSSMDGFAVRAADLVGASPDSPVRLDVVADIPAGMRQLPGIEKGQAARIMTGAPIPPGADSVVPVEYTNQVSWAAGQALPGMVLVFNPVQPGDFIRPVGQDLEKGEVVLPAGHQLRPQDSGMLAMLGLDQISVIRRPRVAVFSTGDELMDGGATRVHGKIYDSNRVTLLSLLSQAGAIGLDLGIAEDNEQAVRKLIDRAADQKVDAIITTAGVSVGAFDFVRSVVEQFGQMQFWRVNMRPGKPFAFGTYREIPFFGLPGNPVSAFVGFEVFVRPMLRLLQGHAQIDRAWQRGRLAESLDSDGRESYLRCSTETTGQGWAIRLTGHQGSGNLFSLVKANALLLVPSGVKSLPIDAEVDFWFLD